MCPFRYRPTTPLEFAKPFGYSREREFKSNRAVSTVAQQMTTMRARTSSSCTSFPIDERHAFRAPFVIHQDFPRQRILA